MLKDGEPCSHKGCLNHVTHPCEGCGRVAGKSNDDDIEKAKEVFKNPESSHWDKCLAIMGMVERDLEDHNHY